MSRLSKISLTIAGFALVFVAIPRLFLDEWLNILFFPLGLFLLGVGVAIFKDRHLIKDFLMMKTTKHGMNMGAVISLTLMLIVLVNYLGYHFLNKYKYDWSKDKLNSLSEQTTQVLSNLDTDLDIKFFYGKNVKEVEQSKEQFRGSIRLYQDASPKVKVELVSTTERPDLAEEFKVDTSDVAAFINFKGRKQRIEKMDEEGITNAIIKVTKTDVKPIYFTTGHGERDLESREATGAADFKQALEDNQYQVRTLKLFEQPKVPQDAAMVVVLGPTQMFLEPELQALREFARTGGKLLIAIDPGQRHNLAQLTKFFGVEFTNTYVVDPVGIMQSGTLGVALGSEYAKDSDLTKNTRGVVSIFYMASALKKAPDAPATLSINETVKTTAKSVLTAEVPRRDLKVIANSEGSQMVMATVSGKADEKQAAPFTAILVGDSDAFTNQFLFQGFNRDLTLNAVAFLADDKNMITIRPKAPSGSMLMMTQYQKLALVLAYLIAPILFFLVGGGIWLRRKYA